MTRTLPDYRRANRTVPCPRCDAAIGKPCRTPQGRAAAQEHGARQEVTRLAFRIGIEGGLRDALGLLDWQAKKHGVNVTVAGARHFISIQHEAIRQGVLRDEKAAS